MERIFISFRPLYGVSIYLPIEKVTCNLEKFSSPLRGFYLSTVKRAEGKENEVK